MQNNNLSEHIYDVLIVGAGPVGLAIAIALGKQGINNILVLDQTREFTRVGQVIDLLPNGLKAIKSIDSETYQQIKEAGLKFLQYQTPNNSASNVTSKREWYNKNLQGEIIRSTPLDFETWFHRYGEGRISLPWYDLQTTLRNLLPSEIVKKNHRCVSIHENMKEVIIDCISDTVILNNPFAHWQMPPSKLDSPAPAKETPSVFYQQFRAKIVVAADGINSTIRQVLYANTDLSAWAKPQYSGWGAIGCLKIDNVPNSIVEELKFKYFHEDIILTLHPDSVNLNSSDLAQPRLMLLHGQNNSIGYLLHSPLMLDDLQNKSPSAMIDLAIEVLEKADFPPIFRDLLRLSPLDKLIHRPYYIHPADIPVENQPCWSRGRVVLVGDAAHGMPPFIAQGANQGLEDAALISTLITEIIQENCLDEYQTIVNQFKKYEQIRRPFMVKIQSATMENHLWSPQQWDDYYLMVFSRSF